MPPCTLISPNHLPSLCLQRPQLFCNQSLLLPGEVTTLFLPKAISSMLLPVAQRPLPVGLPPVAMALKQSG